MRLEYDEMVARAWRTTGSCATLPLSRDMEELAASSGPRGPMRPCGERRILAVAVVWFTRSGRDAMVGWPHGVLNPVNAWSKRWAI